MFLKNKRIIQKVKQAMNLEDNQKGQKNSPRWIYNDLEQS